MWKRNKLDQLNAFMNDELEPAGPMTAAQLRAGLDPAAHTYATQLVERLFRLAVDVEASDIHIDAVDGGHLLRLRIDGRLLELGIVPAGQVTSIVSRLKALARLVTYRSDVPQEGRLQDQALKVEARVVTLPTLHGERMVVRLGGRRVRNWRVADLGLNALTLEQLNFALTAPSGVILVTGPVGSGKTTSAYAAIRSLATGDTSNRGRCVVTLEDPIECELPGVAQSQIEPALGYDWASGLKALLRQDPEVMLIGEIRDAETAQIAFRAAMTGQLVISTMHARSTVDAIVRLIDLQVPTQHILAGLQFTISQRLVRKLCECSSGEEGLRGCEQCKQTGWNGRLLVAESMGEISGNFARAVCTNAHQSELQKLAIAAGLVPLSEAAESAVAEKLTTAQEIAQYLRYTPIDHSITD